MQNIENMNTFREAEVKLSVRQLANGRLTYDITTKGETVGEAMKKMIEAKVELGCLCKVHNELLEATGSGEDCGKVKETIEKKAEGGA